MEKNVENMENCQGRDVKWLESKSSLNEAGKVWPLTWDLLTRILYDLKEELYKGKSINVLELGSGTGILGIELWKRGANVVVSDLGNVVEELTRLNVEKAKRLFDGPGRLEAKRLEWGNTEDLKKVLEWFDGKVDVVVLCEGCYWGGWDLLANDTRDLLKKTLDGIPNARVYIEFTVRDLDRELGLMKMLGWKGGGEGGEGGEIKEGDLVYWVRQPRERSEGGWERF